VRSSLARIEELPHETEVASAREHLWSVQEVARFLNLHPKTVYAWVARGAIPHIRLGRRVVFSPADIGRWLGARKEGV